ncbi:MAG: hypothetical protein L3J23_03775 [Flavobacteriaceae bacterium]|nr:hypothetical protein [Flavobacteriaceae bacterium]
MKTIIPILLLAILSCKSSKFEKKLPFKIKKATFQHWVGGQPGVKGIKIAFELQNLEKGIVFHHIYFKNTKEKLYLRNATKNTLLTANINTANRENIDVIIHRDASKEYGNKLPKVKSDFLFELKENECVISYLINEKEKFYKITLIEEKHAFFP